MSWRSGKYLPCWTETRSGGGGDGGVVVVVVVVMVVVIIIIQFSSLL
jgi:hypothetical protein